MSCRCLSRVYRLPKLILAVDAQPLARSASSSSEPQHNDTFFTCNTESRFVPKTFEEVKYIKKQKVISPETAKVLTVAVLGLPNAGKSTLTNKLMEWRLCSVSKKVHTTKRNTSAVYIDGDTQMIFVDTPGLVCSGEQKRFRLNKEMLTDPENSLAKADVVLMLFDVSNRWQRHALHPNIMRILSAYPSKPTVLVLNKIDLLNSKSYLIDITQSLTQGYLENEQNAVIKTKPNPPKTGDEIIERTLQKMQQQNLQPLTAEDGSDDEIPTSWRLFKDIFMISALHNDGIKDLRDYLLKHATPGNWQYPEVFVTDQGPKEVVLGTIREKLLDHLDKEIPYLIDIQLVAYDFLDTGILSLTVNLNCHQSNLVKIVIGPNGAKVMQIADEAKQELMNTFRCGVSLKVVVQHKKSEKK